MKDVYFKNIADKQIKEEGKHGDNTYYGKYP